jgi:hypothetical protein
MLTAKAATLIAVVSFVGLASACTANEPSTPEASVGDNTFCVFLDNVIATGIPRSNVVMSGIPTDESLAHFRNRLVATANVPTEFDDILYEARERCVEMKILSAFGR